MITGTTGPALLVEHLQHKLHDFLWRLLLLLQQRYGMFLGMQSVMQLMLQKLHPQRKMQRRQGGEAHQPGLSNRSICCAVC